MKRLPNPTSGPAKPGQFGPLLLLALGLSLSACTASDDAAEWGGTVRDSAGIRLVENPAEGMWAAGDEWRVSEALTIGADTMDLPYQFGRVTSIAVGPDGSIFVLDNMAADVRAFDQAGVHLRTIGRRGAGPGEFSRAAAGVFLVGDERLVVPDMGNSRINSLGPTGEFLGSMPASYASGFPVRWDDDGSGEVVVQRRAMGGNEDPDLAAGDPLVRIGNDGEEQQLLILPLAKTVRMVGARPQFTYFETEPSWDLGPSGTLRTAMTQEYRIELRGRDGALHTVVSKVSPRIEVTAADRDHFAVLMREGLTLRGTAPDAVGRFIDRLEYGATFPAFNQIMEGPDGTTLVQQIQTLSEMTSVDLSEEQSRRLGSTSWDVFDASGRYLGAFDLPARFTPLVWEDAAVYGRWLDDVDRHYVKKLDLIR
jgi:hypothetical protein